MSEDSRWESIIGSKVVVPSTTLPIVAPSKGNALTPALQYILLEVRRDLTFQESLNSGAFLAHEIEILVVKIATRLNYELAPLEKDELCRILEQDRTTFGILQPLIDDLSVSDIIITEYSKIAVQQGRRTVSTGYKFPNQSYYLAYLEKLLARAHASISTKKPIADGVIDGTVRLHAVHQSICETGPYLTLRINRFESVSLNDLAKAGLAPLPLLQYLAKLVEVGATILIVGEVGTGKTTLTRALAAEISVMESILVIEDTPEIQLAHPQVRYIRTRENNLEGEGRISPANCIRAGMRMAMNRIIFGEIRDAESAESLIDVCASGHPGISTLHGRSVSDAIIRLELLLGRAQPGVGRDTLLQQIGSSVGAIIHIGLCSVSGARRIFEVRELGSVADSAIRQRPISTYLPINNEANWKVVSRSSLYLENTPYKNLLVEIPPLLKLGT